MRPTIVGTTTIATTIQIELRERRPEVLVGEDLEPVLEADELGRARRRATS